mmetsp:Transcript_16857/g.49269  ORF Transcript_16857/g.49269 Transcript_16857/m.49269 type:complete len:433 (+) Transcript_16857:86-1384(+)
MAFFTASAKVSSGAAPAPRPMPVAGPARAPACVPIPYQTLPLGARAVNNEKGWSRLPEAVDQARAAAWAELQGSKFMLPEGELLQMKPATREYYAGLYALVRSLKAADSGVADVEADEDTNHHRAKMLIYGSFVCNVLIFAVKVVVAVSSGALVVYASTMDSFLDLLSGSILVVTARIMARPMPDKYPVGTRRMEPLGVIVFATIMGTCFMQVVVQAIESIVVPSEVVITRMVLILLGGTVGVKLVLYAACRTVVAALRRRCPSLEAQTEDHFNDCASNLLSVVGAFFASSFFAVRVCGLSSPVALYFIDPTVAMLFSAYVIYSWARIARENLASLVGTAAPPNLARCVTYLAACHCSEVVAVDTVRIYSIGQGYIAEVDIVLPPTMENKQAHDIAEALQIRVEGLAEIERCFVHVDWETSHKPEHKGTARV